MTRGAKTLRGSDGYNESLFTTVRLEEVVPANHPLRPIRAWMNESLAAMDALLGDVRSQRA